MRIAVTGASGFVGRAVIAAAQRRGHEIISISRASHGDLNHVDDLSPAFAASGAVIHLAALVPPPTVSEKAFFLTNHVLALKVARAARAAGVRRFVQMSSVAAINPRNAYGRSKLAAETDLANLMDLSVVCLRPPAVLGPRARGPVGLLLKCARRGLPLPLGRVNNRRSLIFVDNLAEACLAACEGEKEGAFVVTDPPPVAIATLYRMMLRASGYTDRLFPMPGGLVRALAGIFAPQISTDAVFDGSDFGGAFDWTPAVSLSDAVMKSCAGR